MSETVTYVAFPSSDALHEMTQGFIDRMRGGQPRPEPDTIGRIMTTFVDEALDAFMVTPARRTGVSPNILRIINFTTETISKATAMVVKGTVKKLDLEQNRKIAEYMDTVRMPFDGVWHICFPISDALAETARKGFDLTLEGRRPEGLPYLLEYYHTMSDESLRWYFERPIALLGFGPILRKLTDVGIATTRKATHSMIDNVIPRLEGEQARLSAEYGRTLLRPGPRRP